MKRNDRSKSKVALVSRLIAIGAATALLGACATVPAPLQGQFSTVMPRAAAGGGNEGEAVRWGGEIIDVEPEADRTCFEVLARDLDASARPTHHDPSGGRFIACKSGFYDPEEFRPGRDLTVVGHLDGTKHGKVGQFDYTYPLVAADAIYLWPKRSMLAQTGYYDPWMGDPFWWGYGPYWGPYWGAPIIVRPHPHPHPPPSGGG